MATWNEFYTWLHQEYENSREEAATHPLIPGYGPYETGYPFIGFKGGYGPSPIEVWLDERNRTRGTTTQKYDPEDYPDGMWERIYGPFASEKPEKMRLLWHFLKRDPWQELPWQFLAFEDNLVLGHDCANDSRITVDACMATANYVETLLYPEEQVS